jgi:peptidoglycan hydrolase-like protein with peptidoglycan-binding domain
VSQGDNGPAVAELQRRLNAAGHSCTVDGEFGPRTYDAVCAFQASHQLEVDGVVGRGRVGCPALAGRSHDHEQEVVKRETTP